MSAFEEKYTKEQIAIRFNTLDGLWLLKDVDIDSIRIYGLSDTGWQVKEVEFAFYRRNNKIFVFPAEKYPAYVMYADVFKKTPPLPPSPTLGISHEVF